MSRVVFHYSQESKFFNGDVAVQQARDIIAEQITKNPEWKDFLTKVRITRRGDDRQFFDIQIIDKDAIDWKAVAWWIVRVVITTAIGVACVRHFHK